MAPPARGTAAYSRYLARQRDRRRTERAAKQKRKVLGTAVVKSLVLAARRKLRETRTRLQAELDQARLTSNRHFRRARDADAARLAAEGCRKALLEAQRARKEDQSRYKKLLEEAAAREDSLRQELSQWTAWWSRNQALAPASTVRVVSRLWRNYPVSPDRGWGGGQ